MTSLYLNIWNKVLYVFALVLRSGGAFNKSNFILRDKIINGFMSINEVKNLEFDINYSGYKIKLGLESYIYSKVFFYGLYERCELEILSKYIKNLKKLSIEQINILQTIHHIPTARVIYY